MKPTPPPQNAVLYSDTSPSPLGQVTLIAAITGGRGVQPPLPLRVYGAYALVCITAGQGTYTDANGAAQNVGAGDAIFVFPDLPHTYGPRHGTTWDEFYVVFHGPAFDGWRQMGVLSPSRPVVTLSPMDTWTERLRGLALPPGENGEGARAREAARAGQVCRLLCLLTEIGMAASAAPAPAGENLWLARACGLLAGDVESARPLSELVRPLGLPYETFRKKFTAQAGQSPARFRAERRMATAAHLMQFTSMTNVQIAERLDFGDEFHFSKRFTQMRGETPTAFRRRVRG